jgi:hypothetical protein
VALGEIVQLILMCARTQNWLYRLATESHYRAWPAWISGILQTALYSDFFYHCGCGGARVNEGAATSTYQCSHLPTRLPQTCELSRELCRGVNFRQLGCAADLWTAVSSSSHSRAAAKFTERAKR